MRRLSLALSIPATLLTVLSVAPRADAASIQYSTTDLGTGTTLQTNPDGSAYGVTNAAGTTTYAFTKVPVTSINIVSYPPANPTDPYSGFPSSQVLTMQNGPYQVGVINGFALADGGIKYPTFEKPDNGWYIGGTSYGGPPVSDLNIKGQAVGTSMLGTTQYGPPAGMYAAFSAEGLQLHTSIYSDVASQIGDNLNNYIATIPGVTLTSAFKIDDLGRILALGSDNHDYLLTPLSLGGVETVPEPTTLVVISVGGLVGLAHAARGQRSEESLV